jgi:DNA polymerase-1
MSEREELVIIDGHALAYRHYYSLGKNTRMTNARGQNVGAVYGFIRHIIEILRDQPAFLIVTFDRGLSGRNLLMPEYKANRRAAPPDLGDQVEMIEEILKAFQIPITTLSGYEADDVIATLTTQAVSSNYKVRIVTGDRDLFQLLQDHVTVELPVIPKKAKQITPVASDKTPQSDEAEEQRILRSQPKYYLWTEATFYEEYDNIRPYQLTDFKGVAGDSSDNIAGVAGIGEKGALKLLKEFASLTSLYANLDRVDPKLAQKLEASREQAFLGEKVATVMRELSGVKFIPHESRTFGFSPLAVLKKLREQQFGRGIQSLLEQAVRKTGRVEIIQEIEDYQQADFFLPSYTLIDTQEALVELSDQLRAATYLAVDTETTGLDKMTARLVGISLSADGQHAYYLPIQQDLSSIPPPSEQGQISLWEAPPRGPTNGLPLAQVQAWLGPFLNDPDLPKVTHNGGYDYVILLRHGLPLTPIADDTMLAQFVLAADRANLGLKRLALNKLDLRLRDLDELIGKGKKQITFDQVEIQQAASYAAGDAIVTYRLGEVMQQELAQSANPKAERLYRELEMPLIEVLCQMEMTGILVDRAYLQALDAELSAVMNAEAERAYALAGQRFNIASPKQLSEILFDKMNFDTAGLRKTKQGNFSLTLDVLDDFAERSDHPIFAHLLQYRALHKLLTTYVQALPELIHPQTGRVHTSFNQVGAVTGRLSSNNPNLQNIPIRTEEGRRIRQAFLAREGYLLLGIDYSQIELRILAHYSADEHMKEAFRQGRDIHASTAASVFKVALESVTPEQRRFAKAVNFGLIYGMGAYRLARDSNFTLAQANQFIKEYFAAFPSVQAYLETTKQFAKEQGYVETLFGRRRDFTALKEGDQLNANDRARMEREAINAPIQGTAADLMKRAMIDVHHYLKAHHPRTAILLQVHDELLLEVPEDELEAVQAAVAGLMQAAGDFLSVPLLVEAHSGRRWTDL